MTAPAIRELRDPADAVAITELFADVWQLGPTDPAPIDAAMLIALAHGGNYVALAEDPADADGRLVGACVGFFTVASSGSSMALHSHIAGVARGQAGRGIGTELKRHQRDWCLARGVETITWTFDPLVARNAHFNLNRLGARATQYLIDFYGPMADGLNVGQPSDRLLVSWRLTEPAGPSPAAAEGAPVESVIVTVPEDIENLRRTDPEAALRWRYRLRAGLADRLDAGWQITGFRRADGYILQHTTEGAG